MWKKTIAIMLCSVLCLCFASCGKSGSNDKTQVQAVAVNAETDVGKEETSVSEASTETTKKAFGKFTFEDLIKHNKVSYLLKYYDTIIWNVRDLNGSKQREGCFFSYEDYDVSAEHWLTSDEYYYSFNGYSVSREDDRYVMSVYSGPDEEREMYYDLDNDIVMHFDMGADMIYDVKETEDCYTFAIGYDGEKSFNDTLCMVSKYDLSIREITANYGTSSETTTVFRYNEQVNDYGFSKDWDSHKLRTVTVVSELSVNGAIADGVETYIAPYNVEVLPYSYGDYEVWGNGEWTKRFVYPGDGCDYTIYFTNIMG